MEALNISDFFFWNLHFFFVLKSNFLGQKVIGRKTAFF